ncbi:TolB-like 6-bladed beta-propeller domain-containing protein [Bacteroides fragilis]|nr:TolB-like 6-bladed beta-propeller domain-containing protein [Bacteroides fragilis]
MKYCLTFLFLLVIFTGCTSDLPKDRMLYASFPKEETLHSKVIQLDSVYMRYPFRVHVSGDQAVVLDLHGTDVYCHLFHYPDFHYLSSFGRRGDSPEEMLSVETVKCIDGSFWTLDANKGELTRFEFVSDRDSLLRAEAISFDKDSILRALDFVAFNDTTFLIPDYSGDSRFCWVNRQGKFLKKSGVIPSLNEEALKEARPALAQAWRSFIDYNPHNGVLVAATQLGEVLEIYNLQNDFHRVCLGPKGEPEFKLAGGYAIPDGIMGFSDVQVTDEAIYAVFHGHTFKEIMAQHQKRGKSYRWWTIHLCFQLTRGTFM